MTIKISGLTVREFRKKQINMFYYVQSEEDMKVSYVSSSRIRAVFTLETLHDMTGKDYFIHYGSKPKSSLWCKVKAFFLSED